MKTLLTAQPGTGKSTILDKVQQHLEGEIYGVVTKEIRIDGQRVGFEAINPQGESRVFMHKTDIVSDYNVGGKYKIDVDVVSRFMVDEILKGKDNTSAVVFIDEIGRAEYFSDKFMETIRDLFLGQTNFIGTIVYDEPWAEEFKNEEEVVLIVVTMENRDYLPAILTAVYKNVELYHTLTPMQQKYFRQQFRRYIVEGNYTMAYKLFNNTLKYIADGRVEFDESNGIYIVKGNNDFHEVECTDTGAFKCDCDLYARRGEFENEQGAPICSHIEAVKVFRGDFEG